MTRNKGKGKMFLLLLIVVGAVVFSRGNTGRQRAVAGIKDPVQTVATGQTKRVVDGYDVIIQFQYAYDIKALVVSTHNYSGSGIGDKLSPKDLALAWGDVAANNKVIDFHWKQSGRWYSWRVNSESEINKVGGIQGVTEHSSNNHMIPADDIIEKQIKKIKVGDYVRLTGYLVNIDGKHSDGRTFYWDSSTTRSDSGAHSCEVMYVTGVEWLD
ncbi:MAG: hypothetical protein IJ794_09690 [Lachnospiraceae bacterium]|nr:hypothetical protein [Lachnospiraceae bacterium]